MDLYNIVAGSEHMADFLLKKLHRVSEYYDLDLSITVKAVLISYGIVVDELSDLDDYLKEKDARLTDLLIDLMLSDISPRHREQIERACSIACYVKEVA